MAIGMYAVCVVLDLCDFLDIGCFYIKTKAI